MSRVIKVGVVRRFLTRKPRGQVLVLVSLGVLMLLGIAALALDIGQLWTTKRLMQSAADAAALAGADQVAVQADNASIVAAAQAAAAQNGFTAGSGSTSSSSQVSINVYNPPTSGPYASNASAVQVVISQTQPTYFLAALGQQNVAVSANAVALTVSGGSCVYALDPSAPGAITVGGSGSLNSACGVYDNSDDKTSALTVSGGGTITAPLVGVVGGTTLNGGGSTPPVTGIASFGDPLAWVQPPSVGSCSGYAGTKINSSTTLNPGLYCGGIAINASGTTVTFNPGTYVIDGGGLTIVSGATVNGSGVTFYLTGVNKSDSNPRSYSGVNIAGGATVNLSAPCSSASAGIPGMLFFQDRSITNGQSSVINGGSSSTFTGTVYFPTTPVSYSGSSGSSGYTLLVGDTVTINGAANVSSHYGCLGGSIIKQATLAQ